MRTIIRSAAAMLAAAAFLAPGALCAQDPSTTGPYARPEVELPTPFTTDPDKGGVFTAFEYVMFRQTNPIQNQVLAVRGFFSTSLAVPGTVNIGDFIGSGQVALDANNVSGPDRYSPGYKMDLGYKFENGSALTLSYMSLLNHNNTYGISFAVPGFHVGNNFADSFITSNVFNFPSQLIGPAKVVDINGVGLPDGAIGVWNAASVETLKFSQRVDQWDLIYRLPAFFETESCRWTGSVGMRHFAIWEYFTWRVTDIDVNGNLDPTDSAVFVNTTSNQMYGPHIDLCIEQYLGRGFACQVDVGAAALLDITRQAAKYSTATKFVSQPESKQVMRDFTLAPELTASAALVWYPYESIEVKIGYNVMAFFNTVSSPNPVSFNWGAPDPKWVRQFRLFDGFDVGFSFLF